MPLLFNSNPVEFRDDSVLMDVNGTNQTVRTILCGFFAGGEPPTAFLKKIAVGFSNRDLVTEGSRETKESVLTPV